MTKVRPPLTIENALYRVLAAIGGERAAEVTGRSAGYLLSLSNPDKRERLTVEDALALDLEFRTRGGEGAPIFETYGLMLEASSAERFADQAALARHASKVAVECGQAQAAIIAVTLPGATRRDRDIALREVEEARADLTHAATLLQSASIGDLPSPSGVATDPAAGGHPSMPP